MLIFWNYVGSEHGGLSYAPDLKKNLKETIQWCLELREERSRSNQNKNRFLKYDENTLLELPQIGSNRKFIIVYLLDKNIH